MTWLRWLNGALMALLWAGALWAWPRLPESIAVHFGFDGKADTWAEPTVWRWFGVPLLAVALAVLFGGLAAWTHRRPNVVNLPGGEKLSDYPTEARGPILAVVRDLLALVLTETLVILGLVQWALWSAASGDGAQYALLTILLLAMLSSPFLMIVFFTRMQGAMDRAARVRAASANRDR